MVVDYGRLCADIMNVYECMLFGRIPCRPFADYSPVYRGVVSLLASILIFMLALAIGAYLRHQLPNHTLPHSGRWLLSCHGRVPRSRNSFSPSSSTSIGGGSRVRSFGGGFNISRNSTRFS